MELRSRSFHLVGILVSPDIAITFTKHYYTYVEVNWHAAKKLYLAKCVCVCMNCMFHIVYRAHNSLRAGYKCTNLHIYTLFQLRICQFFG